MGDPFAALARWITEIVHALGYAGIAFLVALENVFPPIPSELVLPLAGFLAGQGRFSLAGVVLAATTGSVAGALVLYAMGRRLGEDRLRRFVKRFDRVLFISEDDLDRALGWFERHGRAAVLFGRLLPLVRSLISVPAGIERMPVWQFTLYTAIGSGAWNGALVGLGWVLGDRWGVIGDYTRWLEYGAIAAAVAGLTWLLWRRRRHRTDSVQQ